MRKKNKKTTKKGGGRGTGRATPPIVADPQGSPAQRRAAEMIGLRAGSAEAPSAAIASLTNPLASDIISKL